MPIRWHFDPHSRVLASVASGRIAPQEIHAFVDDVEPMAVAQQVVAHLHISAEATPDLLKLGELTGVAQRIQRLLRVMPTPWFPNAIIATSAVQYGVTRMVLGLIGDDAPVEAFRDVAAAAAYAKVDPALAQQLLDTVLPERSSGAA
jgi:hypothetical protein